MSRVPVAGAACVRQINPEVFKIRVSEGITLGENHVDERFVRAVGPGGQNARKEATAIELRLDISASTLPADIKERLKVLAGRAVTSEGVLVVVSRAHRSQVDNREEARNRLVTLLSRAATLPAKRRPTKPRTTV